MVYDEPLLFLINAQPSRIMILYVIEHHNKNLSILKVTVQLKRLYRHIGCITPHITAMGIQ